jgi:hypothetical protein
VLQQCNAAADEDRCHPGAPVDSLLQKDAGCNGVRQLTIDLWIVASWFGLVRYLPNGNFRIAGNSLRTAATAAGLGHW